MKPVLNPDMSQERPPIHLQAVFMRRVYWNQITDKHPVNRANHFKRIRNVSWDVITKLNVRFQESATLVHSAKLFSSKTHTGAVKSKLRQTTIVDTVQKCDSGMHLCMYVFESWISLIFIENCLFPLDDQHNCGTINNIFYINMILLIILS